MDSQSRNLYREYDMAMEGPVQYDEQPNYYAQTSSGYMLPSTGGMIVDYSNWGTRACDPVSTRQSNGDFFDQSATGLSQAQAQAQAQAAYGFTLPQGLSSDLTQSSGVSNSFPEEERTLPTPPTHRSQPQPQPQASLRASQA
jgi:hypothetical protein